MTREQDSILSKVCVQQHTLSDHSPISCSIRLDRPKPLPVVRSSRNLREVDVKELATDLGDAAPQHPINSEIDLKLLNQILVGVADKHAPVITRQVKQFRTNPWYTGDIHKERQLRRRLERKWLHSGLEIDRQLHMQQCSAVVTVIKQAKSNYYKEKLVSSTPKEMFHVENSLLKPQYTVLPSCESDSELANRFANFFIQKVDNIRIAIDLRGDNLPPVVRHPEQASIPSLDHFDQVSEKAVDPKISSEVMLIRPHTNKSVKESSSVS